MGQGTKKSAKVGGKGPEKMKAGKGYYFVQAPKDNTKSTSRKR